MASTSNLHFCPNCGSESQGRFCSSCGAEIPVNGTESSQVADQANAPDSAALPAGQPQDGAQIDARKWWEKKRFAFPIIGVVILILLAYLGDSDTGSEDDPVSAPSESQGENAQQDGTEAAQPDTGISDSDSGASAEVAEPAPPEDEVNENASDSEGGAAQPAEQSQFIGIFEDAIDKYSAADTELQAANVLNERDDDLCAVTNQGRVDGWVGVVDRVGANGDGKGIVAVEIAPDLILKTWNNAFSDILDDTLIEPSSALFDRILPLEGGETVRFSGRFADGSNHCLKDSRLTDSGRSSDPDFIFKFEEMEVVG